MARLGLATFNELVGRVELLRQRRVEGHPKANKLNLTRLLANVAKDDDASPRHNAWNVNAPRWGRRLDDVILQDAREAVNDQVPVSLSYRIKNTNRTVGAKLSGEIAYLWGEQGLPEGTIELKLSGSAGQSFGAFLTQGVKLILTGEANDYVGKGMSGGGIIIKTFTEGENVVRENCINGKTFFYCAKRGEVLSR